MTMTVQSSFEDPLLVEVQEYNRAQQPRLHVRHQNSVKSVEQLYDEAITLFLNSSHQPNVDAPVAQQQQEREQHYGRVVQQWEKWCHNVSQLKSEKVTVSYKSSSSSRRDDRNKESTSNEQAFQLQGMKFSVYFIRALWDWSQARMVEKESDQWRSNDISAASPALFFRTTSAAQQQSSSSNKEEQLVQNMTASLELIYCSMISLGYFDSRSSSQEDGETNESSNKIRPAFLWLTEPLCDKTQNTSTRKTGPSSLHIRSIIQTWHEERKKGMAAEPGNAPSAKRARISLAWSPTTRNAAGTTSVHEQGSDDQDTMYKKAILSLPWILMHRVSNASIKGKNPSAEDPSAAAAATTPIDAGGVFGSFFGSQKRKRSSPFASPPNKKNNESHSGNSSSPERKKLNDQMNCKWKAELFYIFSNADLAQHSRNSRHSTDVVAATISWTQLDEHATHIREWCHPLLPVTQSSTPPPMHTVILVCLGLDLLAMRTPRTMLLTPLMAGGEVERDESLSANDTCYVDVECASMLTSLRNALPWKVASMGGVSAGPPRYLSVEGLDHMCVTRQLQKPGVPRAMKGFCYPEQFPFATPKASPSTARTIFSYYETMVMLDILDCFLAAPRTALAAKSALKLLDTNTRLHDTSHLLKLFHEENVISVVSAGTPAQGSSQSTSSSTAITTLARRIKTSLFSFGSSTAGASSAKCKSLHNPWREIDVMLLHRLVHTKLTLLLQARDYREACALCNQVEDSMESTSPACTTSWKLFVHDIVRQHNGDQESRSSSHVDPPILSDGACHRLSNILKGMEIKVSGIKTVEGFLDQQISIAGDPNAAVS
jgi:hypothetical protein